MADYYAHIVIQPVIPVADMTALEHLVLNRMFDCDEEDAMAYFYNSEGVVDVFEDATDEIRQALEDSAEIESRLSGYVAERLAPLEADTTEVEIDMSGMSWELIFQDIVRRSPSLTHVTTVTTYSCSKMRPDGFGCMIGLITGDTIIGKETSEIIEYLMQMAGQPAAIGEA